MWETFKSTVGLFLKLTIFYWTFLRAGKRFNQMSSFVFHTWKTLYNQIFLMWAGLKVTWCNIFFRNMSGGVWVSWAPLAPGWGSTQRDIKALSGMKKYDFLTSALCYNYLHTEVWPLPSRYESVCSDNKVVWPPTRLLLILRCTLASLWCRCHVIYISDCISGSLAHIPQVWHEWTLIYFQMWPHSGNYLNLFRF